MRISNRFTTLLFLIICGLLISGVSGDPDQYSFMQLSGEENEAQTASMQIRSFEDTAAFSIEAELSNTVEPVSHTLISTYNGPGYSWSDEGSLLTIHTSGSYAFADMTFPEFGIYVDAPLVQLDGRKWIDADTPTSEQVMITGHTDPEFGVIGIHGNESSVHSLDLSHVSISLSDASGRVVGVTGANDIFNSSIEITGKKESRIIGIGRIYGTFDTTEINIFGNDATGLIGIQYLYGTITGGQITIDVPLLSKPFEMIGVYNITPGAEISGGTFNLTGIGYGYASGAFWNWGSITGGTFDIQSNSATGIEIIHNGTVSGGIFDVEGFFLANAIGSVYYGSVNGGEYTLSGKNTVGIYNLERGSIASGGEFVQTGTNSAGIYRIYNDAQVQGGTFRVHGLEQAGGIFEMNDAAVITGGLFHATASEADGVAAGLLTCRGGTIIDGKFYAESNGEALGLELNECIISGGEFWAVSPKGYAIGISNAVHLPDNGVVTAWAETQDKATGVLSPALSGGEEKADYTFVYNRTAYIGNATQYAVNNALVREIYDTEEAIIIIPHTNDQGAVIVPDAKKILKKDPNESIFVSFDSHPGYDLASIYINKKPHDIVEYIELNRDKDYFINASSVKNQIHVDFSANVTTGTVPLAVTFEGEAEDKNGAVFDALWSWDFGSNDHRYKEKSDNDIVSTVYTMPGTYTVLATATDDSGSATVRKTGLIVVEPSF